MKGKLMAKITIDPTEIMSDPVLFSHIIWMLLYFTNREKTSPQIWYANGGISAKIKELWELIK